MKDLNKLHGRPPRHALVIPVEASEISEDALDELMEDCDEREINIVMGLAGCASFESIKLILDRVRANPNRAIFINLVDGSSHIDGAL